MCQNNPQMEIITIWGFTEEEIDHRWAVHMKFDTLTRLLGSDDKEKDIPKANNNEAMFAKLESMLTQG